MNDLLRIQKCFLRLRATLASRQRQTDRTPPQFNSGETCSITSTPILVPLETAHAHRTAIVHSWEAPCLGAAAPPVTTVLPREQERLWKQQTAAQRVRIARLKHQELCEFCYKEDFLAPNCVNRDLFCRWLPERAAATRPGESNGRGTRVGSRREPAHR